MRFTIKICSVFLILLAILLLAESYQIPTSSRRDFFGLLSSSSAAGMATVVAAGQQPANAILSSKYCAAGVGEGCDDLAGDNAFIKQLQERSAANKEQNEREARYAFYMKNYPDWFAAVGQNLVMKPDGTFVTVSDIELEQLKKENKLTVELPKTKGGRIADVTQKPIIVMKE